MAAGAGGPNQTAVLDTFNRANAATLGANWTADPANTGVNSLTVAAAQCSVDGSGFGANWWNVTQFGAGQEAFLTITTAPDNESRLYARIQSPGTSSMDCYLIDFSNVDTGIYRLDNSTTLTLLGANLGFVAAARTRLAITCLGSTISCYRDQGGAWAFVASRTDVAYPGAGYIGAHSQNNAAFRFIDFGGGQYAIADTFVGAAG